MKTLRQLDVEWDKYYTGLSDPERLFTDALIAFSKNKGADLVGHFELQGLVFAEQTANILKKLGDYVSASAKLLKQAENN